MLTLILIDNHYVSPKSIAGHPPPPYRLLKDGLDLSKIESLVYQMCVCVCVCVYVCVCEIVTFNTYFNDTVPQSFELVMQDSHPSLYRLLYLD